MSEITKMYPLALVDDVLEKVGLPKTKPLLEAVSPENILGSKLGITAPGEVLEGVVDEIDRGTPMTMRGLPKLPGMR